MMRPKLWKALAYRVAPSIEHFEILEDIKFDYVIDVGANRGQFALLATLLNPNVKVMCFEPIPSEFKVLTNIFSKNKNVTAQDVAIGNQKDGQGVLHISNWKDSSSMLPIGELQETYYPGTSEVDSINVKLTTLDSAAEDVKIPKNTLVKIDVQGFELQVLQGAVSTLKKVQFVLVESSKVELYEGQALFSDVDQFLTQHGFGLIKSDQNAVDVIQSDYLYENTV